MGEFRIVLNKNDLNTLVNAKNLIVKYGYNQHKEMWISKDSSDIFQKLNCIITKTMMEHRKVSL